MDFSDAVTVVIPRKLPVTVVRGDVGKAPRRKSRVDRRLIGVDHAVRLNGGEDMDHWICSQVGTGNGGRVRNLCAPITARVLLVLTIFIPSVPDSF